MIYRFRAAEQFWKSFYGLPSHQKTSARQAWVIFKNDPFDSRLRTHRIYSLSALYKRTIYAVVIEGDLRSVFYLEGNTVFTVDIGSHDVYRT
jgi:hypothetical protein